MQHITNYATYEIKIGKFKPEYAEKMNFYLGLFNKYEREEGEKPAIGIILCADRNRFEVNFALQDIDDTDKPEE